MADKAIRCQALDIGIDGSTHCMVGSSWVVHIDIIQLFLNLGDNTNHSPARQASKNPDHCQEAKMPILCGAFISSMALSPPYNLSVAACRSVQSDATQRTWNDKSRDSGVDLELLRQVLSLSASDAAAMDAVDSTCVVCCTIARHAVGRF